MSDREKYIDKMAKKLKEWDAEIRKLETRVEKAQTDAEAEFYERIEELKSKRAEVEEHLEKLQDASNEAWQEIRNGFEQSWKTLNKSFKKARNKFKKLGK
ncbi:MAG: coiled coil domain-containing protein [Candidatus Marinimicrobia bacterium]|nr:coiled coil domain-containing protein [Candidatus Neomarinimicrobiota bacterium]